MRDGRVGQVAVGRPEQRCDLFDRRQRRATSGSAGSAAGSRHLRAQGDAFTTETFTNETVWRRTRSTRSIAARDGAVWAGTLSGGVSRLKDGVFTTYTAADGLASNTVAAVLEAADGTTWFAHTKRSERASSRGWRRYSTADGLPSNDVNTLLRGLRAHTSGSARPRVSRWCVTAVCKPRSRCPCRCARRSWASPRTAAGWLWIATADRVLRVDREGLLRGALARRRARIRRRRRLARHRRRQATPQPDDGFARPHLAVDERRPGDGRSCAVAGRQRARARADRGRVGRRHSRRSERGTPSAFRRGASESRWRSPA